MKKLSEWECWEPGWWVYGDISVVMERDGKWHPYVRNGDTPDNTPAFKTMRSAMRHIASITWIGFSSSLT
jgi:hypothetical protein